MASLTRSELFIAVTWKNTAHLTGLKITAAHLTGLKIPVHLTGAENYSPFDWVENPSPAAMADWFNMT